MKKLFSIFGFFYFIQSCEPAPAIVQKQELKVNSDSLINKHIIYSNDKIAFSELTKTLSIGKSIFTSRNIFNTTKWQNSTYCYDSLKNLIETHDVFKHQGSIQRHSSYSFYLANKHVYEVNLIIKAYDNSECLDRILIIDNVALRTSEIFRF